MYFILTSSECASETRLRLRLGVVRSKTEKPLPRWAGVFGEVGVSYMTPRHRSNCKGCIYCSTTTLGASPLRSRREVSSLDMEGGITVYRQLAPYS